MTMPHICVHAFAMLDNGDVTYADPDRGDEVFGWCTYIKVPDLRGGRFPFETTDYTDYKTRKEALAAARLLRAQRGFEIEEY